MSEAASDEQWQHGESQGSAEPDYDLVRELSQRLGTLRRYDQFIANADGRPDVQACWQNFKSRETELLKALMTHEIKDGSS